MSLSPTIIQLHLQVQCYGALEKIGYFYLHMHDYKTNEEFSHTKK